MKTRLNSHLLLIPLALGILSSCTSTPTMAPVQPVSTEAPMDTAVATEVLPTATLESATAAVTAAASATPTEEVTRTAQVSPTQDTITATATANQNCRKYPSNTSAILGYFKKGQQTEVLGKDASGEWYLIPNLTYPDREDCWVFNGNVELSAGTDALPVLSATRN